MKRYFKVIIFVVVIIVGVIYFNVSDSFKGEVVTEGAIEDIAELDEVKEEEEMLEDDAASDSEKIIIDIKGEINAPGVYEMQLGDRMIDIVDRAGGLTDDASETAINLAEKLQDEMAIIIPKEGDEPLESNDIGSMESGTSSKTDKLNLNHATQSELETLNGIGPSKAEAIISYREENGLFQTVEDVLEVNGIGEKTLESFKDDIKAP